MKLSGQIGIVTAVIHDIVTAVMHGIVTAVLYGIVAAAMHGIVIVIKDLIGDKTIHDKETSTGSRKVSCARYHKSGADALYI